MIEMKDFDADSFELTFEENTSEEERKYYVETYPNVNMVSDRRIHCTSCDTHIGVSVSAESLIRMHPVLRVTHCKKCHTFYNSGEFSKGEDGSELYCRWCGQGGEVYCCASCPYVFCKKCIVQNLSKSCIKDILSNDNWTCFKCSPDIMKPLRAQHWALVNYIEKTKQKIVEDYADDADKIVDKMKVDASTCCKNKPDRKKTQKDSKLIKKRKRRDSESSGSTYSRSSTPDKKRQKNDGSAVLPSLITTKKAKTYKPTKTLIAPSASSTPLQTATMSAAAKKQLDDIVCTPDIMSMFSEPADETSTNKTPTAAAKKISTQPPPLIIRQLNSNSQQQQQPQQQQQQKQGGTVQRRIVTAQQSRPAGTPANDPTPVYHTINGFRIDLNSAAQQETYRLPNGKLIQVKKQPTVNPALQQQPQQQAQQQQQQRPMAQIQQQTQFIHQGQRYLLPTSVGTSVLQPQAPQNFTTIRYNVQPVIGANRAATIIQQPHIVTQQHQQLQQLQTQQLQLMNGSVATVATTAITKYPDTPLGQVRAQLETQVRAGQDICQHINGKLNTLTISNAYKTAKSYNDVKELHIHLSYLFTYAIGRFKTLQDKCTEDMKALGYANDAANMIADKERNYKSDEDDLEIVEPEQQCIEIDSDDDLPAPIKGKNSLKAPVKNVKKPKKLSENGKLPTVKKVSMPSNENVCATDDEDELMEMPLLVEIGSKDDDDDIMEIPTPPALSPTHNVDIATDKKLNSVAQILIHRVESLYPSTIEKIKEQLNKPSDENISSFDEGEKIQEVEEKDSKNEKEQETSDIKCNEQLENEEIKDSLDNNKELSNERGNIEKAEDKVVETVQIAEKHNEEEKIIEKNVNEIGVEKEDEPVKICLETEKEDVELKEDKEIGKDDADKEAKICLEKGNEEEKTTEKDDVEMEDKEIGKDEADKDIVANDSKNVDSEAAESLPKEHVNDELIEETEENVQVADKTDDCKNTDNSPSAIEPIDNEINVLDKLAEDSAADNVITDEDERRLLEEIDNVVALDGANNDVVNENDDDKLIADDDLENISSPDMFEDLSKNGLDHNVPSVEAKEM